MAGLGVDSDLGSDDEWAPGSSGMEDEGDSAPATAPTDVEAIEQELAESLFGLPSRDGLLSWKDAAGEKQPTKRGGKRQRQQHAPTGTHAGTSGHVSLLDAAAIGATPKTSHSGSAGADAEGAYTLDAASDASDDERGDYEYGDDDDDDGDHTQSGAGGFGGGGSHKSSHGTDDIGALESRYGGRIKLGMLERMAERAPRHTGRDDRATVDLVLDPRTRLILFRLVSQGVIKEIYGCVSAGKEANVYYATRGEQADWHPSIMGSRVSKGGIAVEAEAPPPASEASPATSDAGGDGSSDLEAGEGGSVAVDRASLPPIVAAEGFALKVYKTSILVFKDRDRYVSGEYRFRQGYSKRNPRKMVKVWAEKEIRNLRRLQAAGVPCPVPRLLRGHVLLMDFLGDDGWPSPRLRDAKLSSSKMADAYSQTVHAMRAMFVRCKLVHGDLSEYNMLWHKGKVVIIDVSQSVESDHPRAMDFLRIDCDNVTTFFGRRGGLRVMTPRELFDFVINPDLADEAAEEAYLAKLWASVKKREGGKVFATAQEEADHEVFMRAFIPRSLAEVADAEREAEIVAAGGDSFVTSMVAPPAASAAGTAGVPEAMASEAPVPGKAGVRFADEVMAERFDDEAEQEDEETLAARLEEEAVEAARSARMAELRAALPEDLLHEAPTKEEVEEAEEAAAVLGIDTSMLPGFGPLSVEAWAHEYRASTRRARIAAGLMDPEGEEDAKAVAAKDAASKVEAFKLRGASKAERKAHKAAVKAAAKEARETKLKKSIKKRKEKAGKKSR